MAQPDQRLSRPELGRLLLGSRLRQANGISSIYAQFEPNGYDGRDADWQTGASHSVAGKGSLEVYFHPGTERKHRAADHRCRHQ